MIGKKKKYKLSDFRYQLPKKYIAQKPKQKRDGSKMMVLDREDKSIKHKKFSDITDYFQKNDLLILNDTKVFPAKLYATKDRTDAKVEIFLLRELGDRLWEVLVKPARKVRIGNKLILSDGLFCNIILIEILIKSEPIHDKFIFVDKHDTINVLSLLLSCKITFTP